MSNRANEPAHPRQGSVDDNGNVDYGAPGMTILEAFTMAAMQGLCANPILEGMRHEEVGCEALSIAIATLRELEKAHDAG